MAEETEDKPTGELTAPAPAPVVKKYIVAIEKPKDDPKLRSSLAFDALNWKGNKGDVLPDNVVAALEEKRSHIGDDVSTLEQWLNIGWIKEA